MKFSSGTRVRLKKDPARVGVLTARSRTHGDRTVYQVQFPDRLDWQPEYELELLEDSADDAYELLNRSRFGRAVDLRRSLSFIHLSGRLANLVYSMEATNADFYAFQYKPVLSFLESPSNGLLIADEVGLGKTIEAGLIWTELRARYDARRLVVFCPAMLREKWCEELRERFGVDADVLNARELARELKKDRHQVAGGKGFVCSIQGARPPSDWRPGEQLQGATAELADFIHEHAELEPLIDLVVIDEAHYMRNPATQTARLGRLLREVTEHLVLLTATPINLSSDDLFHLLNLVDPDSFHDRNVFPEVLAANEPLLQAATLVRDKTVSPEEIFSKLRDARDHELLCGSIQLKDICSDTSIPPSLSDDAGRVTLANRIEKINLLRHAVTRTRKREVTEWQITRQSSTQFISLPEGGPEQELYEIVTAAVREYAQKRGIGAGFLLASPQRQVSSCMYAAAKSWTEATEDREMLYEDLGLDPADSDTDTDERAPLISHIARSVLPTINLETLRRTDSKYDELISILRPYLVQNPDEKVILFSYFRGTLRYLMERLGEDGVPCDLLMGGLSESKQEIINRFQDSSSQRVLLSSEVASEGVDLQFCRLLINYDLPWNPMKVEQRIGRIDRLGQKESKIHIWNLLYAGTIDHRIHERLMSRIGVFERALGGLEAILGSEIRQLTIDLLSRDLTPQQESKRIDRTALAIEQKRQDEENLERDATNLIAHSDFILEQVKEAYEFNKRITREDLIGYVRDYLQRYWKGYQFHQISEERAEYDISLPTKLASDLRDFIRKEKLFGSTRLDQARVVRCQFSNKVGTPRDKNEQISQFHPFVRFISDDLNEKNEGFYPLLAIELGSADGDAAKSSHYAFGLSRWHFNGLREEEELKAQVFDLDTGSLLDLEDSWEIVNDCRLNGRDWISAADEINVDQVRDAFSSCMESLGEQFEKHRHARECENKDRSIFQVRSAERNRDRQLSTLREMAERYEAKGSRMLPATLGRIENLEKRFEVRVEGLRRKAVLTSRQEEICYGVINHIQRGI